MTNLSHGIVCEHVKTEESSAFYRHFIGQGTDYNLLCSECGKNLKTLSPALQKVSLEQFEYFDLDCEELIGEPQILAKETDLKFIHEPISLEIDTYLDIQPFGDQWITITSDGALALTNLKTLKQYKIFHILESELSLSDDVKIVVSANKRYIAIINQRGQHGIVIDIDQNNIVLNLDRGTYHFEQTNFPVAFVERESTTLIIHATDWNRLDITDLGSLELLTGRFPTEYIDNERPQHYLDYFHGELTISPDSNWIIEDGWVWHPYGVPRVWNLSRWLNNNVWESDDGDSIKKLTHRGYFWGSPMCWINNEHVVVWGFGTEDDVMVNAVQVFNVVTGNRIYWFAGPQKDGLFFDTYLFSTSNVGTDIWDVHTGERLLHDKDMTLLRHHVRSGQFLSKTANNVYQLSSLEG